MPDEREQIVRKLVAEWLRWVRADMTVASLTDDGRIAPEILAFHSHSVWAAGPHDASQPTSERDHGAARRSRIASRRVPRRSRTEANGLREFASTRCRPVRFR